MQSSTMKNINSFLLISLFFVFSCNTEAKFGFREKVKVETHSIAKSIVKPHITEPEIKVDNIDTCEIITTSVTDEKIILPHTPPQYKTSNSIKKIFADSRNQEKKNDDPIPEKELNRPAIVGFLLTLLELMLLVKVGFFALLLLIPALVLSIIGYIQISNHREKYRGLGFATFGILFGTIVLLLSAVAIYLLTHLTMG